MAFIQCIKVLSEYQNKLFYFSSLFPFNPKPATFCCTPDVYKYKKVVSV